MAKDLIKYIRCKKCLTGGLTVVDKVVTCSSCGEKYFIKKDKIFFWDIGIEWPDDSASGKSRIKTNWTPTRRKHYEFFKEHFALTDSSKVILDLGAGPGQFKDLMEKFDTVIGIDMIPFESVDVIADLNDELPFKNNAFDIIVASNLIEHIPDTKVLLNESLRILQKGGVFYGTIPFLLDIHQAPYDFHRYTPYMLEKLFNDAGFCDVTISILNTPTETYSLLQRHYFMLLFDSVDDIQNILKKFFMKFFVKVLWNIHKLLNFIAMPVMKRPKSVEKYTLSYGIVAKK